MTNTTTTAAIGIGTNLADRRAMIALAERELRALPGVSSVVMSTPIETPALTLPGTPPQPAYLNAAAVLETILTARELLTNLLNIERTAGRDRTTEPRWGARVLDLDLLLFGSERISEKNLTVPHPRMHERTFVLEPLAEICPAAVHPVLGSTIAELLQSLRKAKMQP